MIVENWQILYGRNSKHDNSLEINQTIKTTSVNMTAVKTRKLQKLNTDIIYHYGIWHLISHSLTKCASNDTKYFILSTKKLETDTWDVETQRNSNQKGIKFYFRAVLVPIQLDGLFTTNVYIQISFIFWKLNKKPVLSYLYCLCLCGVWQTFIYSNCLMFQTWNIGKQT